ncbi:hypothetical protein Y032_0008g250 [Ancylostoma ceylanicum]|uniref:Uncharacterized protein n=1 Tax=Ancylostoma ceylanicum TaxID=53326 RepID=A0A016VKF7_9BILA|nr:hypothetical protein Y032_0008g250 [Ancylostoma ceylanicum]
MGGGVSRSIAVHSRFAALLRVTRLSAAISDQQYKFSQRQPSPPPVSHQHRKNAAGSIANQWTLNICVYICCLCAK